MALKVVEHFFEQLKVSNQVVLDPPALIRAQLESKVHLFPVVAHCIRNDVELISFPSAEHVAMPRVLHVIRVLLGLVARIFVYKAITGHK